MERDQKDGLPGGGWTTSLTGVTAAFCCGPLYS